MGRAETNAGARAGLKLALIVAASLALGLWALGPCLRPRAQPAEDEVDEGRAVTVFVGGCQVLCTPSASDPRAFTISVLQVPGCELLWNEIKTACQDALARDR